MKKRNFALILIGALFAGALSSEALAGTLEDRSAKVGPIELHYKLFSPTGAQPNAPLFVVLHGCTESASDILAISKINEVAEARGFYTIAPEQTSQANPLKCWNWFTSENLTRAPGELAWIAQVTKQIIAEKHVDSNRVFAMGLSAGAAMSSNLIACYSEIYSGALIHSGLEFAAASNQNEAQIAMSIGPKKPVDASAQAAFDCSPAHPHLLSVIVFHGVKDTVVNPVNGERIFAQFKGVNKRIQPNAAVHGSTTTVAAHNASSDGASAEVADFDGVLTLANYKVDRMNHAWSGGAAGKPYSDPKGISATDIGVSFLLDHH